MEALHNTASAGVLDDVCTRESSDPAPESENNGPRHLHLRIPLRWLAIGALVAALTGTASWAAWAAIEHHQRDVAATQALAAAKKYALTLCNIDATTVDKNFTELFNDSTAEFNEAHNTRAVTLRQMLIDKKVTAHGTIAEAAVQTATSNTVQVGLLVDQSVSTRDTVNPEIEHTRITLTMEKVSGRWLASDVKLR
ncbi:Mce protein [Mycobacterium sp. HUMS_1102779]|uniref:Mce protein n=1 Tax=Mycobacterium sp. HUMS_1102779 TaxID=3383487 RepID=UPI00389B381B